MAMSDGMLSLMLETADMSNRTSVSIDMICIINMIKCLFFLRLTVSKKLGLTKITLLEKNLK